MTIYNVRPLQDSYVISQDITAMQAQAMQDVELRAAPFLGIADSPTFGQLYNVPFVPGLPSGPVSGEIVDPSGGAVTVPIVTLPAHPADYVTMTGVMQALEEGPHGHAETRPGNGWGMALSIATAFVGVVLVALGLVLNDPMTHLVWSVLNGRPV